MVGTLDNFLRPVLIRRGADLPLLLIMAGVIGGLLSMGLVGLFVGPVLLAVTYRLIGAWVDEQDTPLPAAPRGAGPALDGAGGGLAQGVPAQPHGAPAPRINPVTRLPGGWSARPPFGSRIRGLGRATPAPAQGRVIAAGSTQRSKSSADT